MTPEQINDRKQRRALADAHFDASCRANLTPDLTIHTYQDMNEHHEDTRNFYTILFLLLAVGIVAWLGIYFS